MNAPVYSIQLEESPKGEDVQAVHEGLAEYNRRFAGSEGYQALTIFLRTPDGKLAGGLLGQTYWGWLHVDILWLDDSVHRQGYGSRMLALAEDEAMRRGCRHAHLDTLSFQALDFYLKLGYAVYGVLDDLPQGYKRYFLQKQLGPGD
jgi:GNAT superfamily N-acetyltransferase